MLSGTKNYQSINDPANYQRQLTPWYWRLVALASSWMVLAGYLLLPGLYAKDAQLKISQAVLSVFVVVLLTAGYSFTALLYFVCPDKQFQTEGVFVPALTSSFVGILITAYNFTLSRANVWGTAAITGTVISTGFALVYLVLILWIRRRIVQDFKKKSGKALWSEQTYYSNYLTNMYPTAARLPHETGFSEDDRVNQQMALLLTKNNAQPSPDANATFHIDLPEDRELQERQANSQELAGSSTIPSAGGGGGGGAVPRDGSRNRAVSTSNSLSEEQAWQQWVDRGRLPGRPRTSTNASRQSSHMRNISREERRREIEMGFP